MQCWIHRAQNRNYKFSEIMINELRTCLHETYHQWFRMFDIEPGTFFHYCYELVFLQMLQTVVWSPLHELLFAWQYLRVFLMLFILSILYAIIFCCIPNIGLCAVHYAQTYYLYSGKVFISCKIHWLVFDSLYGWSSWSINPQHIN